MIALQGCYLRTGFFCSVVGVYASCLADDRKKMWREISMLPLGVSAPLVMVGDMNETLHHHDRYSGSINTRSSNRSR